MSNQIWSIEHHTGVDKSFEIIPPARLRRKITLSVDYDDVEHVAVDELAEKIVKILNDNLDKL